MKSFDFILVGVAGLAPIAVLCLAAWVDRKRRTAVEQPPQEEKLLRPPGHSLALRFDEVWDRLVNRLLLAIVLCVLAGTIIVPTAPLLAQATPPPWLLFFGVLAAAPAFGGVWMTLRIFRMMKELLNIRLGMRGEQAVAEALHEAAKGLQPGFR
jgi:hypothetical protein